MHARITGLFHVGLALVAGLAPPQEQEQEPVSAREVEARMLAASTARDEERFDDARVAVELALQGALELAATDPATVDRQLWQLAGLAQRVGAVEAELRARTWCREYREATLPADHLHLQWARGNLAACLNRTGDLAGAYALETQVAEAFRRQHPPDHPLVLKSVENLALTMNSMGRFEEARELLVEVLAQRERAHADDERALMQVRMNLGQILRELGDYERARRYEELALEWFVGHGYPPEHVSVRICRNNLALTLRHLGKWDAAIALQREVLDTVLRVFPEDHNEVQRARINLSGTLRSLGDLATARVLGSRVVAVRAASLPADHPDLALSRESLAATLSGLGELEGARELLELALASYRSRGMPDEHLLIVRTRTDIADLMLRTGELDAAAELLTENLAAAERRETNQAFRVPLIHLGLARVERARGNLDVAERHARRAEQGLARVLYDGSDALLLAREVLASILLEAGAGEELGATLEELEQVLRTAIERSHVAAARESNAWADPIRSTIWNLDRFARDAQLDAPWEERVFELAENLRAAAVRGLPRRVGEADAEGSESARVWDRALHARRRVHELVAGLGEPSSELAASRAEALADAVLVRDRAEGRLFEAAPRPRWIDVEGVSGALAADSAAIGFLVAEHPQGARLVAHVVRRGDQLIRVELGSLAEVEALVQAWRLAMGVPSEIEPTATPSAADRRAAGEELRRRVLDPVLAALGDESRLRVCLDGPLHLVPIDALPLDEGLVGDRFRILSRLSLERAERSPVVGSPALVAFGGVEFNTEEGADSKRSGALGMRFGNLAHSLREVEELAELFRRSHEGTPSVFTGSAATKKALLENAPGAGYLHLATHGFFLDGFAGGGRPARGAGPWSFGALVHELAPLTLCGVALAGANGERDLGGGVPGVITGEELGALDLTRCELAVLSACDTSRGMRSAGRGLQSLQGALLGAGARSALTSLWRVDDESMRLLMEEFYRRLWIEGETASDALWGAKKEMRAQRAAPRDWAGWILTESGD